MTAETPDPLTREYLETFVRTALAGHFDSATQEEENTLLLVQKLAEVRTNLISLSAPSLDGLCTFIRMLAVTPVWENPSVRAGSLLNALLETPAKPGAQDPPLIDDSLPTWKKLQIAEKRSYLPTRHSEEQLSRIAKLVCELYDPASTTVAGILR